MQGGPGVTVWFALSVGACVRSRVCVLCGVRAFAFRSSPAGVRATVRGEELFTAQYTLTAEKKVDA